MEETRRERKKRQTRQLLVDAAFKLFAEQGYERTTIAQIASEADVSMKTFFNHFPAKEDVVFGNAGGYTEQAQKVIAQREPGESIPHLLLRLYDAILATYYTEGPTAGDPERMETYKRIATTVPAVQAKSLHVLLDMQRGIAEALVKACPDELDPITAAAAIGSLLGAAQAASLASSEQSGLSEEEQLKAVRRGLDLAMKGLNTLGDEHG
ncbi:TetR family transcriptional regulator [Nonomuraea deserti]|uniref:TetR family transcriptional regulator n=1 Tax=Nonomuraea deserti TaxID=1848322 RepID=A0A4V2Y5C2_9ACTN|nr:TetR/AcrR family transcriptional regulator [Nonomuraea deserti]TDC83555.1 TetR family transcriptional regulator [Nonomuraea deserti]